MGGLFYSQNHVAKSRLIALFVYMNSNQIAVNILMCAIRYRRKQVIEIFGSEFEAVLFHTLAELSKNHTDKEYLLYHLIESVKGKFPAEEGRYEVNTEVSLSEVISHYKSTPRFLSDDRLSVYDDLELEAVLEDFVTIVKRILDRDPELKEKVSDRIRAKLRSRQ